MEYMLFPMASGSVPIPCHRGLRGEGRPVMIFSLWRAPSDDTYLLADP